MRVASFRAALLAGSSLTALALPVWAQDAQNITLDTVVIDATAPTQGYVVPTAQIGTKTQSNVLETQQSVSVITAQQYEDQGAQTVAQALRYTAGVTAEPYGADPRFDGPMMRGYKTDTSQYLNGLQVVRKLGAPSQELYGIERIEVLRGPSSSLYGGGSPAGIVNMVQKHAQDEDFAEAGVGYGSFGKANLFFDVNRAASDTMAYRLTGVLSDAHEQVEDVTNKRGYLAGAFRWNLDDVSTLDLLVSYQKDSPISSPGVPYALTQQVDAGDLRDFYAGFTSLDDSDRKTLNVGMEYKRDLENGWQLEQNFRYQKFEWDYVGFYTRTAAEADPLDIRSSYQDESSDTLNVDTRLLGEVTTGAATHKLLFGMDVRRYSYDTNAEFGVGGTISYFDPSRNVALPRASTGSIEDLTLTQIGVYAQDEITWNQLRATFGLRYDSARQRGTVQASANGTGTGPIINANSDQDALTGRAGLSYVGDNGIAPYVSYAKGFEPGAGVNFLNEPLKPTKSRQWEVGVKYQPTGQDIMLTAAVYDLKQQDVALYVDGGFRQIGEVRTKGLELEGTAELPDGWNVRASYTYADADQNDATDEFTAVANQPLHTFGTWVERDFNNGFTAGAGVRYVGSRKANTGTDLNPYALIDIGGSYTRDNIEASVNVTNLTDKEYLASCGFFGCYFGDGRELQAKLAYKW